MDNRVCFMFGHAATPNNAVVFIKNAAERHYREYGIRTFVVGNRGNFDRYALKAISLLKQQYTDISLILLLAYHPQERPIDLPDVFDGSCYPPLEHVPKRYAIVCANQYMINEASSVICYVKHPGNARNLLEYAGKKRISHCIPIENIADRI